MTYANPKDHYPDDPRRALMTIGGLSVFSVIVTVLILLAVFSQRACIPGHTSP